MNSITARRTGRVIGLIITMAAPAGWAGPPPNPTDSDIYGNTAGGTGVLINNQPEVGNELYNTGFGMTALTCNTTGEGDTAFGARTLYSNTTGYDNSAFGLNALSANTTATGNTALGSLTLEHATTGSSNTAIGFSALHGTTTGRGSVAVGHRALVANTTGRFNVAVGNATLERSATGLMNIGIGWGAGQNLTSGSNNIYLGHPGLGREFGTMRLGNVQTVTYIAGVAGTSLTGSPVVITGNGQLGIVASSARYKSDIQDMGQRSRALMQLRPVTFHYKSDARRHTQYGLIAEEVSALYPDLVVRNDDGSMESIQYHALVPMLLNEFQAQQQTLTKQREQLRVQADRLELQSKQMAELSARQKSLEANVAAQGASLAARLSKLEMTVRNASIVANR